MDDSGRNERYRRIVENIDQLPSLPSVVTKLIEVINSPDSSAEDAASLIERDPALTSKMLRLANSAFYGMPRAVSSVSSAVVILGFNAIRSLVLSASLVKMFSHGDNGAFDKRRFWLHSIFTAMGSRIVIRHFMQIKMMDPESAFCAGILHDIGRLIFDQFVPGDYRKVCEHAVGEGIPLIEAENAIMGINHSDIGRIIADKWALPLDLEYSIVHHHTPEKTDKITDLISAVHIADGIVHDMGVGTIPKESKPAQWEAAREILKLDDPAYEKICGRLKDEVDKSREFLSIISQ